MEILAIYLYKNHRVKSQVFGWKKYIPENKGKFLSNEQ